MRTRNLAAAAAVFFALGQSAAVLGGFIDITRPGDTVKIVNGFNQNDGDIGPPPSSETEVNAIDDTAQKYLNFLDLSSGVAVTPTGNAGNLPVTGIRLYTANDEVDRDPASFQLSGSNVGLDGPWTFLASGNLELPATRNTDSAAAIPPMGNSSLAHQEVMFANTQAFNHYQITFPTLKDAANANSMQIAEVELLVVPEPAAMWLVGLGVMGLAAVRRRRR